MDRLAAEAGVTVVFPQGGIGSGQDFHWDPQGDIAYLDAVRADFGDAARRVCVAGRSAGARMACRYAAARADAVAVLAAVAGLLPPEGSLAMPVPVIAFHGLRDRVAPFAGGVVRRTGAVFPPVAEAARAWAAANGVGHAPVERAVGRASHQTVYGEGTAGEVILWTLADGGHTWPGCFPPPPLRLLLGRTNMEVDATAEIWRFHLRHAS